MSNIPLVEKTHGLFKQLICYASVGIASNLAGYLVYLLATYLGATPKITMTVLYGIGAVIGYIGNRNLTFAHKESVIGSGARYLLAHCFGYLINIALLIVFVDKFGYVHQWVQAIGILIVALYLFIAFKFFVFTNSNLLNTDRL